MNRFFLSICLTLPVVWVHAEPPATQEEIAPQAAAQFIPADAVAVVTMSPSQLLENPSLELFPVEVFRVQAKEAFGADFAAVSMVKAVFGLGQFGPQFGVVMRHDGSVDFDNIKEKLGNGETAEIRQRTAFALREPRGSVGCKFDETTVYIGMPDYLEPMLDANNESGPLPDLVQTLPSRTGIHAAIAMESIRPMVSAVAMQQSQSLAPDLQPLGEIPELTESILIHLDLNGEDGVFQITLLGIDDDAAIRIESILEDSLAAARALAVAELKRNLAEANQSDAMVEAIQQYSDRIADFVVNNLKPKRDGNQVTMSIESRIGVANVGIVAGMLLPAVQSARTAARRMSMSNNMKQVMLAMHNYHSAFKQLPTSAILDDDGKPLLSWRVAILPFIEEHALYEKFHLDEPWDSENNLPLSKQLPLVFQLPGVQLPPGKTVIHAVVGEDIGMRPLKKTQFRDFLDGLSNSILIVEGTPQSAVVWSKPEDLEIDLDDPLDGLKGSTNRGFHVGMTDGAVKFITDSVDTELFKKMLTRAGKEVINDR